MEAQDGKGIAEGVSSGLRIGRLGHPPNPRPGPMECTSGRGRTYATPIPPALQWPQAASHPAHRLSFLLYKNRITFSTSCLLGSMDGCGKTHAP